MQTLTSILFPKQITTGTISSEREAKDNCLLLLLTTEIALSAIREFQAGNLRGFDALVGETSCQLRAAKIRQLASNPDFSHQMNRAKELITVYNVGLKNSLPRLTATEETIAQPLFQTRLTKEIERDKTASSRKIGEDEQFIILSHALFRTRSHANKSITDEGNLSEFLPEEAAVSGQTYQRITDKAKRELTKLSVQFIQQQAKIQTVFLRHVFKTSCLTSCDLICAPCFFSMEVILNEITENGGIIVLKVGNLKKSFPLISEDKRRFVRIENPQHLAEKPAFVIEGTGMDPEELEAIIGIDDARKEYPYSLVKQIILTQAAEHPQYAGTLKHREIGLLEECASFAETIEKDVDPLTASVSQVQAVMKDTILGSDLERAQKRCTPADIGEITLANLRMKALKRSAEKNTLLFSIEHIYCNLLRNVL